MPERKIVITLSENDVQSVEQAVLDRDGEAALDFLIQVLKPRIGTALVKGRCKPDFEM